ncbi:hypothetical protein KSS87_005733 [Heliosperma pusillum]|nr:hypothetical protein KSS87_005733 [Heliosperma pusillum]
MANRTAITAASLITSYVRLLHLRYNRKLTMEFLTVIYTPRCFFPLSYFSSTCVDYPDYSATETTSSKQKKKNYAGRLTAVIDAANDRKLPPELRGHRNNVRSETDIINVVEQRIWKSMEEGNFENLPGKGKPLDLSSNPHADPAEDTLYRILSKNGCAPEWVELNKQIRTEAAEWRSALQRAWAYKMNGNDVKWTECADALKSQMNSINNKVFRYNLVVPFGRQMVGIKWERELDRLKDS